ncbi:hypothetical protein ACWERF_13120 [Streptomyces griseoluteus]
MTRIPDAVAVASLDTHRLIVAVPNEGPAEITCNLPRPVAASVLRQIADGLDSPAGRCETALATGRPCPVHDAPTTPPTTTAEALLDEQARQLADAITTLGKARGWSTWAADYIHPDREFVDPGASDDATEEPAPRPLPEAMLDAGRQAAEGFARGMRKAQRPAGLDALLAHVAAAMGPDVDEHQAAAEPDALTAGDVRDALAFNADERDPALATLRDVLLDTTATRTPEQALAAARILFEAHARQIAALVEAHHHDTRTRWGLTRSTRGLLTGYEGARKIVTAYADGLANEQALAEGTAADQAQQ